MPGSVSPMYRPTMRGNMAMVAPFIGLWPRPCRYVQAAGELVAILGVLYSSVDGSPPQQTTVRLGFEIQHPHTQHMEPALVMAAGWLRSQRLLDDPFDEIVAQHRERVP